MTAQSSIKHRSDVRSKAATFASDGDLFTACRRGDESAWTDLVHRHKGRLEGLARYRGNDPSAAQDVVQHVFCDLFLRAESVHDADAVGGWLSTATKRRGNRTSQAQRRIVPMSRPEAVVDHTPVDEGLLREERVDAVRRALAQLPATDQRLLALLFTEDDASYDKIAAELGCPIGSIGPTRGRALRRLKALLAQDPLFAVAGASASPVLGVAE